MTETPETKLRHQRMERYILPMREGGSLPLLGEGDDGFKYVVKMRGAGHGAKALTAELIGGEVARAAGLRVPELVTLDIDEAFGRTEPDPEIQDLLKASTGLNLGLHFLAGAITLDPWANPVDATEASRIVWLDAFLTNVDRTPRNTNMLVWHNETWLIDHGASLYFHHSMSDPSKAALTPFAFISDHALIRKASALEEADAYMRSRLTPGRLEAIVDMIPEEWLTTEEQSGISAEGMKDIYKGFLTQRLANSEIFLKQATDERRKLLV
ncbi:MAG: aminotransferase class I and II [Duncaniella sp.]|nr:aminotransferase class I and II [Duncaniella sp.]